jgi:hypothetical protein
LVLFANVQVLHLANFVCFDSFNLEYFISKFLS